MPPNRSRHRSGGALFLGSPPRLVCGVNSHSTIPRPASARRGCGNAAKGKGTPAAFSSVASLRLSVGRVAPSVRLRRGSCLSLIPRYGGYGWRVAFGSSWLTEW